MKAPSPAFSFYPKDVMTDERVSAMTDEEFGVYVRLLCHAWLEGSIPAELGRIARMLRRPPRTIRRLWPAIAPCWEEADGRLTQRKLEAVRAQQVAYSERQRQKGIKSGKARVSNRGRQPRLNRGSVPVQPETNLPFPFPSPSATNEQRTTDSGAKAPGTATPSAPGPRGGWVGKVIDAWPGVIDGGHVGAVLKPVVAKYGEAPMLSGLSRWLAAGRAAFGPEVFAREAEAWIKGNGPPAAATKPSVGDRSMAAYDRFAARREDGTGQGEGETVRTGVAAAEHKLPPGA